GIERAELSAAGAPLALRSGGGQGSARFQGVSAFVDASSLAVRAMPVAFEFAFRGNESLALRPWAGDTSWRLRSPWPHPSFQGGFLPASHAISGDGFSAEYRISNLALGRSLVDTSGDFASLIGPAGEAAPEGYDPAAAAISLIDPVDIYSRVDRSVKYGFLIIGFTFLAYLMFDVIAGVRVSAVEYLLVGAGLVLFFVMLLAFAEVVGFALAFLIAGGAIVGLTTAYSAAVLRSWRRAALIGGLLAGLYAVLFVLLSLESFALLIGSLLLFAALAAVMYLTRNLDWGGRIERSGE
ncbi:MAG: inner membrane CreD family protein, partial [Sphingomonadaceae bacterium]|nr:inner membrane CreD family protein [Sphingomonadaceae bacterium]